MNSTLLFDFSSMTLDSVAAEYNTTAAAIQALNPNFDFQALTDNLNNTSSPAYIVVPVSDTKDYTVTYTVQFGDTIAGIASALNTSPVAVQTALGMGPSYWSTTQVLCSPYPGQNYDIVNTSAPPDPNPPLRMPVNNTPPQYAYGATAKNTDNVEGLAAFYGVSIYDIVNGAQALQQAPFVLNCQVNASVTMIEAAPSYTGGLIPAVVPWPWWYYALIAGGVLAGYKILRK